MPNAQKFNVASQPPSYPAETVTAFLKEAREGSRRGIAQFIAKYGPGIVHAANASGKGAIAHAAETGRTETIALLLQHGASVNARDNDGNTPLMAAAQAGHPHTVKFLLDRGAEVNAENDNGLTPLRYAALHKDNSRRQGQMPERKKETIRLLVRRGASADVKDMNGIGVHEFLERTGHFGVSDMIRREVKARAGRVAQEEAAALEEMRQSLALMRKGLPAPVVGRKPARFGGPG